VARTGETGSTDITPWLLLAGGAAAAVLALIMRKRSVLEG
jgi:LPXTG-motif cell wall-anchored protein